MRAQAVVKLIRRLLGRPKEDRGVDMVRVGKRLAELNMQQARGCQCCPKLCCPLIQGFSTAASCVSLSTDRHASTSPGLCSVTQQYLQSRC